MSGSLKSITNGQTLVLTISNSAMKNALSPEMYAAGIEALSAAENNTDIRSVVVVGEGNIFCSGGNLQRLMVNRREVPDVQLQSIEGLHNWIDAIRTYPKPIIAAVEGAAAGAGFSLALACDLIVAASNAVFVMSYSTVALSPDGGGSWALGRALPRALASELLMCGERISSARLHELGVINRVCGVGNALTDALIMAELVNARAPNALASIKDLLNDAATSSLSQQLASERDHFVRNLHDANGAEGIEAFLQKRSPKFH